MTDAHSGAPAAAGALSSARHAGQVPLRAVAILAGVFVAGLFTAGFDQGHLFSVFQGAAAFDAAFLHEMTHDMRHAAGLPCH